MSIFDKKLLDELVRLAQVQNPMTGTKPNAAIPESAPRVTPQSLNDIAKKLVTNLQSQLAAPQFTSEKPNADLRMQAKDLNSLLNFITDNGIATNGLKISYKNMGNQGGTLGSKEGNPELTKLTPEQQELYVTYPYEAPRFFVYKDGLIAYLQDLKSKNIPLLSAMADKLIEQANDELGLKMSKDLPAEHKELGPDIIVDELPSPLTQENANDSGPAVISIKDLVHFSSPSAFINNIMGKLQYSKDGTPIDLRRIDKSSICEVVNILMERAQGYRSSRPDDPRFDEYLKAVTHIASTYSCPVKSDHAGGNAKPVGYRTQNGGLTDAAASALATSLPLDPEEIDLNRIEAFVKAYAKYTNDQQRYQLVMQGIVNIRQRYNNMNVQNLTRYSIKDISQTVLENTGRKETSPAAYISSLSQVLRATENMLSALSSMLKNSAGSKPVDELRSDIAEQMTYFSKNMASINRWEQDMRAEFNNLNQRNR